MAKPGERRCATVICCWPQIPATIESLKVRTYRRALAFLVVSLAAIFTFGCASSFGPGYTVEKQDIQVHFVPGPPPHIAIEAKYELKNTGIRPLSVLELRLPWKRRFKSENVILSWDGRALTPEQSAENPRNALLKLPGEWTVSGNHTLQVSMELETPAAGEAYLAFAPDAFFLPAEGWAPELLPARGLFATGGIPPSKWELTVRAPQGFVVHASGNHTKISKHGGELIVRARQRAVDVYPFVIAGRYVTKQIGSDRDRVYLWTRVSRDAGGLRAASDLLVKTLQSYDAVFGQRSIPEAPAGLFGRHHAQSSKNDPPLWLVECPVIPGCFSGRTPAGESAAEGDDETKAGEMVSLDTAMIDIAPGANKIVSGAAPALAATWLGYGQSPGFYEQDAPLSAFPRFAALVGDQAINGAANRTESIRRALALVPKEFVANETGGASREERRALRAKSLLFFYGLQDRYGDEVFRKAVRHMLRARRNSGFDLNDLIAAFDQEAHGNTAEFVRLWMKHPGVPADFRARYENTAAEQHAAAKETTP